jgi:hypothetical protein
MPATTVHCPLCNEIVPATMLYDHQAEENRVAVEYTLSLIKERHQEWSETDPVCQRCWDYYRKL